MKKLFTVIRQGKLDEVKMILEKKPVLFDAINATITSLCYRRVDESDIAFDYVKLLIEKGADVNKSASNGFDSINWSICNAELLFERPTIYPNV